MTDEYERWKASQAAQWARRVLHVGQRARAMEILVEQARAEMDGLKGVRYDRDGSAGTMMHGDDAVAALVERMDNAIVAWVASLDELEQERTRFTDACGALDPKLSALLTLRYLDGMPWADVADSMGYTEGYVRDDLNERALAALYDVMPWTMRDPVHRADAWD